MADPLATYSTRRTLQSEKADPAQVRNSAGGHVFDIGTEARVRRFLTLGTDGGTYYTSARELTRANAEAVVAMAERDPFKLVDAIVDVSERGAAPRANPALFALAIAASVNGDAAARRYALDALPQVARTGTHLFLFAGYVEQFRGWGRGLRRAVADWYIDKTPDALAYQAVKYRQRGGWSHRDLLRLAHPSTPRPGLRATFDWICRGSTGDATPALVAGFLAAQEPGADVPGLVRDHRLSWEMLPDAALEQRATWEALLDMGMPPTALMRQLPRLTNLGLLSGRNSRASEVAVRLADRGRLQRARVHPMNVLVAQRTYAAGQSARGAGSWTPARQIVDALDAAFYAAFGAVTPTGKRTLLALDVSGSMMSPIGNMPMSCRDASAALALVTMATEANCEVVGFTAAPGARFRWSMDAELTELAISPRQRLDDAIRVVSGLPFGGTDCALPMVWAKQHDREFDAIQIYTDNETWAGNVHPHQALAEYRQASGIDTTLAVVGMISNGFSIADPADPRQLDVVGMDSAVPSLLAEHARGF